MHTHTKSKASEQSSCINSRSYAVSERTRASTYWNNQPSCHLEDYIQTQHSFQPQIHMLPLDLYPNRSKIEVSKDERFERLIDNQLDKQEQLYKIKMGKEEQIVKRHCTFRPNASKGIEYDEEVFNRLYEEGIEKQKNKEKIVPQISSDCTFHPRTNSFNILNSQKTNLEPLYVRFKESIKKQLERKAQLKRKVEQQDAIKQTPFTINQQSQKIIEKKQNFNKDVVDRLLSYMKETEYRNKIRIQQKEQKLNALLSFAPEINPVTIDYPTGSFVQRQQILAEEGKQRMNIKHNEIIKRQCPFRPRVSIISDYLINIKRIDENEEQKIQRLCNQYPIIKQLNIQRIKQEAYRQCTFHPEINAISKQLYANHIHHCCGRPKETDYPHKPHLNSNSLKMAVLNNSRKKNTSVVAQSKTDKIKMELEYKQMKECTFKPKTLSRVTKSEITIEKVNGFSNFMRTKDMKEKQEEKQKQIQDKLFRLDKRYDLRVQKQTKINEFKLSKSNKDNNAALEENMKRFQENCPFKPNAKA